MDLCLCSTEARLCETRARVFVCVCVAFAVAFAGCGCVCVCVCVLAFCLFVCLFVCLLVFLFCAGSFGRAFAPQPAYRRACTRVSHMAVNRELNFAKLLNSRFQPFHQPGPACFPAEHRSPSTAAYSVRHAGHATACWLFDGPRASGKPAETTSDRPSGRSKQPCTAAHQL